MQTQLLPTPNQIFPPLCLSSFHNSNPFSSPTPHRVKLSFNHESKSGFLSSLRKIPKSLTSTRNCSGGDRITLTCGEVQDGSKDDEFYMRRCVELATKAIGCSSPNPMVGCVIVKDGKVVGEGFHPKAGQPHAEVFALRDAGNLAEDATAYVSLEPCNHYGKTPPCSEALIKAKVKRVVVGMVDPNPIVDSKGLERLRAAGIDVTVGVEEELCKRLNEAFIHRIVTGKPFVTLRYSISVNGHILDQLGEGVTEAGGYYSQLLQEYDAIILSASVTENSIPASQEPGACQPYQIIAASAHASPIQIPGLSEESSSKVIVFTDRDVTVKSEMGKKGIETVNLHQLSVNTILEYCYSRGFCSILMDLRGNYGDMELLLKECIEQNLFQKIVVEVLPVWNERDGGNPYALLDGVGKGLKVKYSQPKMSCQSIVLEGYL